MHAEEPDRQQSSGHLILSDGTEVPVKWEIYLLPDATIRSGIVRGDPMRLLMAAEDRLVILRLDASKAAAIAIECPEQGVASFTPLLLSVPWFYARTIFALKPMGGETFAIVFLSATGKEFTVFVPTTVIRDFLPVLQQTVPPAAPDEPRTSFFRFAETWSTAVPANHPYVCIKFDNDEPVALTPEDARLLAAETVGTRERIRG